MGALGFSAAAAPDVVGFCFDEDNGSLHRPAALAGPLHSILAVRQAHSAARPHGDLGRPAAQRWTRPAPPALAREEFESAAARWRWIMCCHEPQCPPAGDTARAAAHVLAGHPEQGWSLLCNGIVLFDDGGLLLPDGRAEAPHPRPLHLSAA